MRPPAFAAASFHGAVLCVAAILTTDISAQAPQVSFNPRGISVSGVKAGEPLAWMMLVRQPGAVLARTRIMRGFGPAKPNTAVEIQLEGADRTSVLLALASVDSGKGLTERTEPLPSSPVPVRVRAVAGETSIAVESPFIELLYVRSRGGAWSWNGGDGSAADADGKADGWITIPLGALSPYRGNPHPPEASAAGDLLLLIDPDHLRASTTEVGR